MAPPPDSHLDLWLAAAVASGWPVLRERFAGEADALGRLGRLEAALGPLPQAVIDAPWDDGDPWGLEVALPGLDAVSALAVSEPGSWWTPGPRHGVAVALERGERLDEESWIGPVRAVRPIGLDGAVMPELSRSAVADVEVAVLEDEVTAALRAVDPALQSWSGRGPDTVAPVVDRETGRFGVVVSLLAERFAPLDGEALVALREAVLSALAGVVLARAGHPRLRLAPDLSWWTPLDGLDVVLWAIGPALPVDVPVVRDGIGPGLEACAALVAAGEPVEIAVVPADPGALEAVAEAGVAVAEAIGAGGGPGTWVRRPDGWAFAATWQLDDPDTLEAALLAFAALPGVVAVRAGIPVEL